MPASFEHYKRRIAEIVGGRWSGDRLDVSLQAEGASEARALLARVRQMQKELRQVKKELVADMKEIRQQASVQSASQQAGFLSILAGRGVARSVVAAKKRDVSQGRDRALAPYQTLALKIDDLLLQMDRLKLKLGAEIAKK